VYIGDASKKTESATIAPWTVQAHARLAAENALKEMGLPIGM
jgi:hypothetical protein